MSFENNTDNSTNTDQAGHWSFETKQVHAGLGALPCGTVTPPACGGRVIHPASTTHSQLAALRAHEFSASSDPQAVAVSRRSR